MGLFTNDERRGISWREQTLDSISVPPIQLLILFGIVIFMMSYSFHSEYKERVHHTELGFRFFLVILLPMILILLLGTQLTVHWSRARLSPTIYESLHADDSTSPWGVALVLVLVLVMLNYQSSFQSGWFPFF